MSINTFWKLVLRILGLWLLLGSFYLFPQFVSTLAYIDSNDRFQSLLLSWGMLVLLIVAYIIIIRMMILKSDWIIEKLKLNKNFQEERINLNIKSSTVLNIAIIVIGGIVIIDNLPLLFKQLFEFFQQQNLFREYSHSSWIIYYLINVVVGYLLISNSKTIAEFIEKRSQK